jgi:hypothetical protein
MTSSMPTVKRPGCERSVDRPGIDERPPGLRWTRHREVRGETQSADRTPVALSEGVESEENLLWDGGGDEPYRSVGVEDGDELLHSGSRFAWMMPLLGGTGNPSPSGVSAGFGTGLLERSERNETRISAGLGPGSSMGQVRDEFAGRT